MKFYCLKFWEILFLDQNILPKRSFNFHFFNRKRTNIPYGPQSSEWIPIKYREAGFKLIFCNRSGQEWGYELGVQYNYFEVIDNAN